MFSLDTIRHFVATLPVTDHTVVSHPVRIVHDHLTAYMTVDQHQLIWMVGGQVIRVTVDAIGEPQLDDGAELIFIDRRTLTVCINQTRVPLNLGIIGKSQVPLRIFGNTPFLVDGMSEALAARAS